MDTQIIFSASIHLLVFQRAPAARVVISEDVIVADHFFDTPERGRCKPRVAKPSDVVLDGTMRGEKGVRENYKVQTSKLLPYRE